MNIARRLALVCCLAFGATAVAAHAAPATTADESRNAPLPTHPEVLEGELDNGVRYLILPHSAPAGRVRIHLLVRAGSLHESDDQRAAAQMVRRMAFHGSRHFPAGAVIDFFESIATPFEDQRAAYVAFDHTLYMLEAPAQSNEAIFKTILLASDILGRLEVCPEELDRQRALAI
ncbi:MAG: insulinase family protein, partial [Planctomycetota bacterium]|nr:insulinase family protein [Planctomycetota bacterium]